MKLDRSKLVTFILGRRVCGPCIAAHFEATVDIIDAELHRSGSLTLLKIAPASCDQCGKSGTIYSVPADA